MPAQSTSPSQKLRRTMHKLVRKINPPKEGPMPGELDSTDVQLARFFGRPVGAADASSSPMTSVASSSPSTEDYVASPATSRVSSRPAGDGAGAEPEAVRRGQFGGREMEMRMGGLLIDDSVR